MTIYIKQPVTYCVKNKVLFGLVLLVLYVTLLVSHGCSDGTNWDKVRSSSTYRSLRESSEAKDTSTLKLFVPQTITFRPMVVSELYEIYTHDWFGGRVTINGVDSSVFFSGTTTSRLPFVTGPTKRGFDWENAGRNINRIQVTIEGGTWTPVEKYGLLQAMFERNDYPYQIKRVIGRGGASSIPFEEWNTKLAEEPAQTKVEPQKTAPAKVESDEQGPPVKLALKFTPADSTTYKVTTDADNSIIWEGADPGKPKGFTGGHTGRKIEITFTQQIQSTDDKGNAVAKITIKQLKYLVTFKNDITTDFDSSRQEDPQNPLSKLIGQSYTIEITPSGEVSKLIDANDARAAVKGDSAANETATNLLSPGAITERHTITALPASDKNQLLTGENWSSIKSFSFSMMGSKAYEKIYTLKEIKNVNNRRIAIARMEAVPSAEYAKELHKEQSAAFFASMSDNIETYTGELKLDLTEGKVEECRENLTTEWLIVDPNPKDNEQPAALKMTAVRSYSIEKID